MKSRKEQGKGRIIKTKTKIKLSKKLKNMGYNYIDVNLFVQEYSQNLKSMKDNIKGFKMWVVNINR